MSSAPCRPPSPACCRWRVHRSRCACRPRTRHRENRRPHLRHRVPTDRRPRCLLAVCSCSCCVILSRELVMPDTPSADVMEHLVPVLGRRDHEPRLGTPATDPPGIGLIERSRARLTRPTGDTGDIEAVVVSTVLLIHPWLRRDLVARDRVRIVDLLEVTGRCLVELLCL